MDKHAALRAFLAEHNAGGRRATHVGGPAGGSWVIPDSELEAFHTLYAAALDADAPVNVIEVCREDKMLPLLIDFDIKGAEPVLPARLYDSVLAHLPTLLRVLNDVYRERLDLGAPDIHIHVLTRPEGYKRPDGIWSDGLHLHSPNLVTHASNHQDCRVIILERLPADVRTLLEPLWDLAPISGNASGAWYMYGSTKPGTSAYTWSSSYRCSPGLVMTSERMWQHIFKEESMFPQVSLFSIRFTLKCVGLKEDVVPLAVISEEMVAGGGGGGGGGGAAEVATFSEDAWLDAQDLLAMLNVKRAEVIGTAHGVTGMGAVQVINALHLFSGGSAQGREVALTFVKRSSKHWSSTGAPLGNSYSWFKNVWLNSTRYFNDKLESVLIKMAKEDSPDAYEAWYQQGRRVAPVAKARNVPTEPRTPEDIAKLVAEITTLTKEHEQHMVVMDKTGSQVFAHRYIYGEDTRADLAGLNDLDTFAPISPADNVVLRSTMAISSHLGTGKTTLNKALALRYSIVKPQSQILQGADGLLPHPKPSVKKVTSHPNILYISGRITFTQQQMGEWGAQCGFKSYQDEPKPFSVAKQPRLFIQTESLHHLLKPDGGLPNVTYEVVLLDEMATILKSLVPGKTQRENLVDNLRMFHHLVDKAHTVIAGDAFLHDREMAVLRSIRSDTPLRLLHNQFNPYSHRTYQQVRIMGMSKDKKKEVEKIILGQQEFLGRIINDLKAGRRVVVVWGSKKVGKGFESIIKDTFLAAPAIAVGGGGGGGGALPPSFNYRFYNSEFDVKVKEREMANVGKTWADLNLLMYTPTITVGVNYDAPAPPFNRLYIYACRGGATARDIFQASLRCRVIEPPAGEPHMVFFLDHRGGGPPYCGRDAVHSRLITAMMSTAAARVHAVGLQDISTAEKRQGWWFFKADKKREIMVSIPSWFPSLFKDNVNEANVCSTYPKEVYAHYIQRCGYTPVGEQTVYVGEPLLLPKETDVPCYWDIPDVESARCKEAKQMRERGEAVPPDLALAVTKHYFKERMGLPQFTWTTPTDPAIPKHVKEALDYMPKWTEDKELVDALWRGRGPCAEDCQERHHKPICLEDCAVSHEHQTSGFKGGFIKHRDQFKLIALNKMSSHEATLSACVGLDYAEGGCTSLSPHSYGAKVIVIQKMCGVLGIPHPGVQHVWSREQWWAIVKEMSRVQEWEDLPDDHMLRTSSLEDRALMVFEMHNRSEGKQSGVEMMSKHVGGVFERWCGSTVDVSYYYTPGKEKQMGKGRVLPEVYGSGGQAFQKLLREWCKSPEKKAAAAEAGKSTPKEVKAWIKGEADKAFPTHIRFHGVHLWPWEDRVTESKVGVLWSLVPSYQPRTEDFMMLPLEEEGEEFE